MKKVLYTVCSANHLAHCKTMLDSFTEFNHDYDIYIGLVDKIDNRFEKDFFSPYTIVEIADMGIAGFDDIVNRYNVIELNCAMKVYTAQYLFNNAEFDILLYLDSDIWIKNSLSVIEQLLENNDILLTPHFTSPFPDLNKLPRERDLLRGGLYNAGFMAMRRGQTALNFLQWWEMHMRTECYYNFAEGMAVDQNWLNFVPLYFPNVCILSHKGANVAYWNLHERTLTEKDGNVWVNDSEPLLFLHISGYNIHNPAALSRHQDRFDLANLPLLKRLFANYVELVRKNRVAQFEKMQCLYVKPVAKPTGIMALTNKILKPLGVRVNKL